MSVEEEGVGDGTVGNLEMDWTLAYEEAWLVVTCINIHGGHLLVYDGHPV